MPRAHARWRTARRAGDRGLAATNAIVILLYHIRFLVVVDYEGVHGAAFAFFGHVPVMMPGMAIGSALPGQPLTQQPGPAAGAMFVVLAIRAWA